MIQAITIIEKCSTQKLISYISTLLDHPSWFQNIGLAFIGIIIPLVIDIVVELEKEGKVLDLRLMESFIKSKSTLCIVFFFLVPLTFPAIERFKDSKYFLIIALLVVLLFLISGPGFFYFKIFTPLIGWIFSEEKRWNMRIEYLEKRKNELQKSKSKSQLIHEIAEEWNCVWSEKSIPYNKQEELFSLFFEMAKIVQSDCGSVKELFKTVNQNLSQISHDVIYNLYKFCLGQYFCLYSTEQKANPILDSLGKLICKDIPIILNDYSRIFGCWYNLVEKKKQKFKKQVLVEETQNLLIEEIFFKNLTKFEVLSKVFKLGKTRAEIIEIALILSLKKKLGDIVIGVSNAEEVAKTLNLFFEKFVDVPNKILVLVLWIFDAFSCLIKRNPDMNKERFWEVIDLFPILKKHELCSVFKIQTNGKAFYIPSDKEVKFPEENYEDKLLIDEESKKLLEKLRYSNTCIDELFKQCKDYICRKK